MSAARHEHTRGAHHHDDDTIDTNNDDMDENDQFTPLGSSVSTSAISPSRIRSAPGTTIAPSKLLRPSASVLHQHQRVSAGDQPLSPTRYQAMINATTFTSTNNSQTSSSTVSSGSSSGSSIQPHSKRSQSSGHILHQQSGVAPR
jgi:hypothetical protein